MKRKLLKTGIPGFDEICGGGILRRSVVLLSGTTGAGKTTFGMQYVVEGIRKFKEPGLYITIEESKDSLFFHMSGYKWDLKKYEEKGDLFILDYPVYEVDQFFSQNSAVAELIDSAGIERVVIDSIMPVALHFRDEYNRKEMLIKLFDNIKKWDATTFVISEDIPPTPPESMPKTIYGTESLCDGWIHIHRLYDQRKGRIRGIEVLKMKGVAHDKRIFPAEISDNGFTVLKRRF